MDDDVRANPHDSVGIRAAAAADAYSKAGRGGVPHPLMFEAFRAGYLAGASDQNPADDGEAVTEEWTYKGNPPAEGDCRKLVTLLDGGMVWVGIRAWHHDRQVWFNGNEPERCRVLAWMDLPESAQKRWRRSQLD